MGWGNTVLDSVKPLKPYAIPWKPFPTSPSERQSNIVIEVKVDDELLHKIENALGLYIKSVFVRLTNKAVSKITKEVPILLKPGTTKPTYDAILKRSGSKINDVLADMMRKVLKRIPLEERGRVFETTPDNYSLYVLVMGKDITNDDLLYAVEKLVEMRIEKRMNGGDGDDNS